VVCSSGHTPLLPFLTARFARELTGALTDENRKGLTPVQLSIKVRRTSVTRFGDREKSQLSNQNGQIQAFFYPNRPSLVTLQSYFEANF